MADYPQVRKHRICALKHEVFDGYNLAGGNPDAVLHISDLCRRAHGSLLR